MVKKAEGVKRGEKGDLQKKGSKRGDVVRRGVKF